MAPSSLGRLAPEILGVLLSQIKLRVHSPGRVETAGDVEAAAQHVGHRPGRGVGRRVKNKHARHNNCIGDVAQAPEIAAGKGTVVPFSSLPWMSRLRAALTCLGPLGTGLVAETNKYFDVAKCGIGWHGDAERRVVVGVRLGASAAMPLKFQWFQQSSPLGVIWTARCHARCEAGSSAQTEPPTERIDRCVGAKPNV